MTAKKKAAPKKRVARKTAAPKTPKPKTSGSGAETVGAHAWLMDRVAETEGKAGPIKADDRYGDKEWLAKKHEAKVADAERAVGKGVSEAAEEIVEAVRTARVAEALSPVVHRPAARLGRPTEYKPEYAEQAEKLCRLGATDTELADFFDVERETIRRWAIAHEDFCGALKAGKDYADERVVRSLYQRATGYSYEAVKVFMPAGAPAPVYAAYTEHVAADVGAAARWLSSRRPAEWREKFDHNHNFDPSKMSDEDLARIAAGSSEGIAAPARDPKLTH